jgi:hypothetical protein
VIGQRGGILAYGVAVYSVPVIDVMAWRLHDQSVQEHLVDLAIWAATDQGAS